MQNKVEKSKNVIISSNLTDIVNLQVGDNITRIYQLLGVAHDKIGSTDIWESVKKNKLFLTLQEKASKDSEINTLIAIIALIYTHSKLFEEFSDWENTNIEHSMKILSLFETFIPETTISSLNEIEITILLLTAYLHDVGIYVNKVDKEKIFSSIEFNEFIEKHNNYFEKIHLLLSNDHNNEAELIENFLLQKFLLPLHYNKTYEYIKNNFNDLFQYKGENFCEELSKVAASHSVESWEYGFKEQIGRSSIDKYRRNKKIAGVTCNIQFLSICLKIADVLSFDEEYFPVHILEYIGLKEKIFYSEWLRHLSIGNWQINNRDLIYEVQCTHPVYQHYLFTVLESIEQEIDKCTYLLSDNHKDIIDIYKINLSRKVNKDYIQPLDFIYGPIKFELNYGKVVNILMGEQLYGKKNIVVRELLQNAIDACNHRRALEQINNNSYVPQIDVELNTRDNHYILVVKDNGVGMDLHIVQNYLINVGSSYYKSKEFEKLKNDYFKKGVNFDPVSKFGIGILSCFMIADKVEIRTCRKNQDGSKQTPLLIQMEGDNKFFVIRETEKIEFGTEVVLFLSDETIEDEDTIFDDFNFFTKLDYLIEKFIIHSNVNIHVNSNHVVLKKNYDFKSFIDYTQKIYKDFKVDHTEKDHSDMFSIIEIDLNQDIIPNIKTHFPGIEGSFYLPCLTTDEGKFSFSNNEYILTTSIYVDFKLVAKRSIKEIIKYLFDDYLKPDKKSILLSWIEALYGIGTEQKLLDLSEYTLIDILIKRHSSVYIKKETLDILTEISSVYDNKSEYLSAITLEIIGNGCLCCDGILINDDYYFGGGSDLYTRRLPLSYNINFTGEAKPNITAARDSIIHDNKFEYISENIVQKIAANILWNLKNNKISNNEFEKMYFLDQLASRMHPAKRTITYYLFNDPDFVTNHLTIKVFLNGKEKLLSVNEIIEKYNGELYFTESRFIKNRLNVYLNNGGGINRDIIKRTSNIKFFSFVDNRKNYFKIKINYNELINPTALKYNCKYYGHYKDKLYVSNQLMLLNSDHEFGEIVENFRNEKYHKMVLRINAKIADGREEFEKNSDQFIEELNTNVSYLYKILENEEFKKNLSSINFNCNQFIYYPD